MNPNQPRKYMPPKQLNMGASTLDPAARVLRLTSPLSPTRPIIGQQTLSSYPRKPKPDEPKVEIISLQNSQQDQEEKATKQQPSTASREYRNAVETKPMEVSQIKRILQEQNQSSNNYRRPKRPNLSVKDFKHASEIEKLAISEIRTILQNEKEDPSDYVTEEDMRMQVLSYWIEAKKAAIKKRPKAYGGRAKVNRVISSKIVSTQDQGKSQNASFRGYVATRRHSKSDIVKEVAPEENSLVKNTIKLFSKNEDETTSLFRRNERAIKIVNLNDSKPKTRQWKPIAIEREVPSKYPPMAIERAVPSIYPPMAIEREVPSKYPRMAIEREVPSKNQFMAIEREVPSKYPLMASNNKRQQQLKQENLKQEPPKTQAELNFAEKLSMFSQQPSTVESKSTSSKSNTTNKVTASTYKSFNGSIYLQPQQRSYSMTKINQTKTIPPAYTTSNRKAETSGAQLKSILKKPKPVHWDSINGFLLNDRSKSEMDIVAVSPPMVDIRGSDAASEINGGSFQDLLAKFNKKDNVLPLPEGKLQTIMTFERKVSTSPNLLLPTEVLEDGSEEPVKPHILEQQMIIHAARTPTAFKVFEFETIQSDDQKEEDADDHKEEEESKDSSTLATPPSITLRDIKSVDDIATLSGEDMKHLLHKNQITVENWAEDIHLREKLKRLWIKEQRNEFDYTYSGHGVDGWERFEYSDDSKVELEVKEDHNEEDESQVFLPNITSQDDLQTLSINDVKHILKKNGITIEDWAEDVHLREKLRRIWINQQPNDSDV